MCRKADFTENNRFQNRKQTSTWGAFLLYIGCCQFLLIIGIQLQKNTSHVPMEEFWFVYTRKKRRKALLLYCLLPFTKYLKAESETANWCYHKIKCPSSVFKWFDFLFILIRDGKNDPPVSSYVFLEQEIVIQIEKLYRVSHIKS